MKRNGETDGTLADKITRRGHPISRVQILRIRHGRGTSKAAARELEKVTGIPWHEFIEPETASRPAGARDGARA